MTGTPKVIIDMYVLIAILLTVLDLFLLVFLPFLGLLPVQHMEVPRLGGLIRAVATGLCQSHSNAGSEPHLQPTP